ncbi:MAG: ankyrin repeat domain-containing protein [Terracidiphilus sp.]|nr:ankyrin repeat domain-containing protein [Terracidiphilus sp.]
MNYFLKLIQTGATAQIAEAVEQDPALVEYSDPQGISALLWAVYMGQPLVRDFLAAHLAAHGVELDIFEAAALGDAPRLKTILSTNPNAAHSFAGDGWTPLHLAAAFGTTAAVSTLLAGGARLDAVSQNTQKNQPLHAALALGRNPETIRLLLAQGADANARQAGGFTPLFSAAAADRRDLVELLLAHGALPSLPSDDGKTPAQYARERGHAELAAWLETLSS